VSHAQPPPCQRLSPNAVVGSGPRRPILGLKVFPLLRTCLVSECAHARRTPSSPRFRPYTLPVVQPSTLGSFLLLILSVPASSQGVAPGSVGAPNASTAAYSMGVSVNEVGITFHALDAGRAPVRDLKPEEVDVFDNGIGPGRILSMRSLNNRPVHMAFLVDTSGSVGAEVSRSRVEAQEIVQELLVQPADEGLVTTVGRSRHVIQTWTKETKSLVESLGQTGRGPQDPIQGTGIFDALFSTCLSDFRKSSGEPATNVIVLLSDGEDTASNVDIKTAIDKCREDEATIYAISPKPVAGRPSLGPFTLRELTEQTGGRLFDVNDSEKDFRANMNVLKADLEAGYFLIYRPNKLKRDGAFHRIVLVGPKRVATIVGTSGFYAPSR
jgi:Ca-activated chloride channel family protein